MRVVAASSSARSFASSFSATDLTFCSTWAADLAPITTLPVAVLFFLFQRVNQISQLKQLDLFARPTVADFLFDKDPLFAKLNLLDEELARGIHLTRPLHTAMKHNKLAGLQRCICRVSSGESRH